MTDSQAERRPFVLFPLRDHIAEEAMARGWCEKHLSNLVCRNDVDRCEFDLVMAMDETMEEPISIGDDFFVRLANAFGTSSDLWRNLHESYEAWKAGGCERRL